MIKMATRSRNKNNKSQPAPSILNKRVENSWLILAKDSLLDNDTFSVITLPHPSQGSPAKYCLDDINNKVFEVVTYNEPYRSWFIGETVKSDGSIQMLTPINPVFLVLPKLKQECSNRAVPIEDLLSGKGYDKLTNFITNLDFVADLKGSSDMKAYKYNEEKTLNWLQDRVQRTANVLREKNIHVTSGAVSATFVSSTVNNDEIDEEFYLKYAFGIISEYLEQDLADKLKLKFNFKPELVESIGKKRKSEVTDSETNKRIKAELNHSDDFTDLKLDNKPEVKKQKLTAKDKARQKAASGTKTISSFFTKK